MRNKTGAENERHQLASQRYFQKKRDPPSLIRRQVVGGAAGGADCDQCASTGSSTKGSTTTNDERATAIQLLQRLEAQATSAVFGSLERHLHNSHYSRPAQGEAVVRELTEGFANRLLGVRVDRYIIDGNFACARFEIDWPENVIAHSIDYFTFPTVRSPRLRCIGTRAYLALQERQNRNKWVAITCA